jgi:hypothetical protein
VPQAHEPTPEPVKLCEDNAFRFACVDPGLHRFQPVAILRARSDLGNNIDHLEACAFGRLPQAILLPGKGVPILALAFGRYPRVPDHLAGSHSEPLLQFPLLLAASGSGHSGHLLASVPTVPSIAYIR